MEQVPDDVRGIERVCESRLSQGAFLRTEVQGAEGGQDAGGLLLSDSHAQFRAIGTNYNQVVKELRIHFSEKKAMALLYKLEKCTIDLVKLSREIVELSREMYAKWEQQKGIILLHTQDTHYRYVIR